MSSRTEQLLRSEASVNVKSFTAPEEHLGGLDADAVAKLIAASADIALVLDRDGTILDTAHSSQEPPIEGLPDWPGTTWIDTVTSETRGKISELLDEAIKASAPRWRQVNHPARGHPDTPVDYCVFPIGDGSRLLAVGRDLSGVAAVQRRLVEVQQSLEDDYWQLRQAESRYRVLFQLTAEPVLVLDAATRRVREANPAAERWLGEGEALLGRPFPYGLDPASVEPVQRLLDTLISVGQADDAIAALGQTEFSVSGSLIRQRSGDLILLRLSPQRAGAAAQTPGTRGRLCRALEDAPEAVVVTDATGHILEVNRAFLDLAELTHQEQAQHQSLDRWLGREGIDLDVLLRNLEHHHSIPLYATTFRGQLGTTSKVEVAACTATDTDRAQLTCGFFIRNVDMRRPLEWRPGDQDHALSVDQMTKMVGQMPLKDLVRESTDLIERLCIEAALKLTGNNRASAAELLGLSRQSLYAKLRRHDMMNAGNGQ